MLTFNTIAVTHAGETRITLPPCICREGHSFLINHSFFKVVKYFRAIHENVAFLIYMGQRKIQILGKEIKTKIFNERGMPYYSTCFIDSCMNYFLMKNQK